MPPPKQLTPGKVRKSISVAPMFSRQIESASGTEKQDLAVTTLRSATKVPTNGMARYSKIRSSSQTPHKVGKSLQKRSGMHTLAVAFKNTSNDYRRQLCKNATVKINSTLESLLSDLHGQSVQSISSNAHDGPESPIRLSLPAKFEHKANKIYQPISPYKISLTHTNTNGERRKILVTLEDRMSDFVDHLEEQKAEIAKLEDEYEVIVGEIWKVGVQCLGERVMQSMLFEGKDADELAPSPARAEYTLFLPEQGTSPAPRPAANKKRVTFDTPGNESDSALSKKQALHFLYGPSRLRHAPIPAAPSLPKEEISALETQNVELGQKQLDELKQAEKDYKMYWQKKNRMLAEVFVED